MVASYRALTERPGQLQTDEVLEAVVSGPELPVLDVAPEVRGKERIAFPKAIGYVDAAAESLLLWTGEVGHSAPDDSPIDVKSQHKGGTDTRGEAREVVPAARPDEVRDDMASGPVAAYELAMIE